MLPMRVMIFAVWFLKDITARVRKANVISARARVSAFPLVRMRSQVATTVKEPVLTLSRVSLRLYFFWTSAQIKF